jgi:hypothetical protein
MNRSLLLVMREGNGSAGCSPKDLQSKGFFAYGVKMYGIEIFVGDGKLDAELQTNALERAA